jgi:hypothetical protein
MKKLKLMLPLAILIVILQVGCNDNKEPRTNASTSRDTTRIARDTAMKDTLQPDPEKFSDPH